MMDWAAAVSLRMVISIGGLRSLRAMVPLNLKSLKASSVVLAMAQDTTGLGVLEDPLDWAFLHLGSGQVEIECPLLLQYVQKDS